MKPKPIPPLSASDVRRFEEKYTRDRGCWRWIRHTNRKGYGVFWLPAPTAGHFVAHRISFALYRHPPAAACVLHRCDVPACVNPDHLFLGTKGDNNADRAAKGRSADMRGERGPNARLTRSDVMEIHELIASGTRQRDIACRFGVAQTTISAINRGILWRHLSPPTASINSR